MSEIAPVHVLADADPAEFIRHFFTQMTADVVAGADHTEVVDRYHTPDVRQVADGVVLDRRRLIEHMGPVQRNVRALEVEVHEAVVSGDRLAARVTLRATGRRRDSEVYVHFFGEFAPDGRLRTAHQLTSMRPSA